MALHTYQVTLSVERVEVVTVTVDDEDVCWDGAPSEDALYAEARDRAYRNCQNVNYVMDVAKVPAAP